MFNQNNNGGYVQPQNQNNNGGCRPQNQNVQVLKDSITDEVLTNVKILMSKKGLKLPANYAPANALQSAFLAIATDYKTAPFLNAEPGTKAYNSLANSLLDMVIMGLNTRKKQCHFIPYNGELKLFKSYFGEVAACKNSGLIQDAFAICIYQGDDVEEDFDEIGRKIIKSHKTKFGNEDNEILGAYAVIILPDGKKQYEIMTKAEIKKAWAQATTPASKYHTDFPQEACKRTVIRRAVKMIMNSSNDENLVAEIYNQTNANEYMEEKKANAIDITEVNEIVRAKTGTKPLNTFDSGVVTEQPQPQVQPQQVRSAINNIVNKKDINQPINQPADPFANVSETAYQNLDNTDSQAINDNDYAYEETDDDEEVTDF